MSQGEVVKQAMSLGWKASFRLRPGKSTSGLILHIETRTLYCPWECAGYCQTNVFPTRVSTAHLFLIIILM